MQLPSINRALACTAAVILMGCIGVMFYYFDLFTSKTDLRRALRSVRVNAYQTDIAVRDALLFPGTRVHLARCISLDNEVDSLIDNLLTKIKFNTLELPYYTQAIEAYKGYDNSKDRLIQLIGTPNSEANAYFDVYRKATTEYMIRINKLYYTIDEEVPDNMDRLKSLMATFLGIAIFIILYLRKRP